MRLMEKVCGISPIINWAWQWIITSPHNRAQLVNLLGDTREFIFLEKTYSMYEQQTALFYTAPDITRQGSRNTGVRNHNKI